MPYIENSERQQIDNLCSHLTELEKQEHSTQQPQHKHSTARGTFSKIDHMIGHKTSLSKLKKTEIISSTLSEHSGIKLKINFKRNLKTIQIHGS